MRKSLVLSWISACDYPLFREWIRKWGVNFFDEIIIYWDVQFRHPFYWAFIQQDLSQFPEIKFIDPVDYGFGVGDWRHAATNELLNHATGDWICSIEQDWFTTNWEKLLSDTQKTMEKSDMLGWMNPTNNPYIHPSYFFIKRDLLETTSKDFSAHPEINGSDHFGGITYDVEKLGGKITSLQDVGYNCDFNSDSDCFHLGGVNQNYLNGLTASFQLHRPEAFLVLNEANIQANVPQDPKFLELCSKIDDKFPFIQEDYERWEKFFKV